MRTHLPAFDITMDVLIPVDSLVEAHELLTLLPSSVKHVSNLLRHSELASSSLGAKPTKALIGRISLVLTACTMELAF